MMCIMAERSDDTETTRLLAGAARGDQGAWAEILGHLTTPSQAAMRAERQVRLQDALNGLDPVDREILALRHFERLSNGEAATVLGLDKSATSKRYARALLRLKNTLASLPGG